MPIKVKQDEENPVPTEVLAKAIVDISDGVTKLLQGGLKERALLVLLNDISGVSKTDIRCVLDGLQRLKVVYTK